MRVDLRCAKVFQQLSCQLWLYDRSALMHIADCFDNFLCFGPLEEISSGTRSNRF